MILLPKKPLYRILILTISFILYTIFFTLLLVKKVTPPLFIIVSIVFFGALFLFHKIRLKIFYKYRANKENTIEEINILEEKIKSQKGVLENLPLVKSRLSSLVAASQKFINLTENNRLFDFSLKILDKMFPEADNALMFYIPKGEDHIELIRSLKRKDAFIREKYGDILDKWVLKNNNSLFINDLAKDFNFNFENTIAYKERGAKSFIVSPVSVGNKVLGLVRMENKKISAFSQDDLRLLRSICDLMAVVMERNILFENIKELATKDSLTGLLLKDQFFSRLKEEAKRSKLKKSKIGIIMLDIDDFKKVNDTYSHIAGDLVLKKLSSILKEVAGDSGNMVCRFGGEEFLISIVECDKKTLVNIGENIRRAVEEGNVSFRRKNIKFTVSLGCVIYPDEEDGILSLIDKADSLLYKAKKSGKNKLCFL